MKQYTAKTLDDVLKNIVAEQGVELADITYTVIDEQKHLFGIGNSVTVEAYTPKDIKEFIFDYLGSYFTELNQTVAIEIIIEKTESGDNLFRVILDAENNAIIIGKNGQTLRAISLVLKAAVNATYRKRINVTVDINHYKEDRYRKIKRMAMMEAKKVAKTKIDVELDPMPNDERKVIQQYLQNMKNVSTVSIGEGNKRHLVIKYVKEEK